MVIERVIVPPSHPLVVNDIGRYPVEEGEDHSLIEEEFFSLKDMDIALPIRGGHRLSKKGVVLLTLVVG